MGLKTTTFISKMVEGLGEVPDIGSGAGAEGEPSRKGLVSLGGGDKGACVGVCVCGYLVPGTTGPSRQLHARVLPCAWQHWALAPLASTPLGTALGARAVAHR